MNLQLEMKKKKVKLKVHQCEWRCILLLVFFFISKDGSVGGASLSKFSLEKYFSKESAYTLLRYYCHVDVQDVQELYDCNVPRKCSYFTMRIEHSMDKE